MTTPLFSDALFLGGLYILNGSSGGASVRCCPDTVDPASPLPMAGGAGSSFSWPPWIMGGCYAVGAELSSVGLSSEGRVGSGAGVRVDGS